MALILFQHLLALLGHKVQPLCITLCRGESITKADLQFDWCGFDKTTKTDANSTKAKQLNPNKMNRRPSSCTVILPLKFVFSA